MNTDFYKDLEQRYKVIYPQGTGATYRSLLNYSDDLQKPFQRWCRYKEGFSVELVAMLINRYNTNPNGTILDPFLGSGSTIIGANLLGLNGAGFEVNPFSLHLAKCKTEIYSEQDIAELRGAAKFVIEKALDEQIPYTLPQLSIAHKVFNNDIEGYYLRIGKIIETLDISAKVKSLLSLGWISKIESFANYRKAGNGLKAKKYKVPRIVTKADIYNQMLQLYSDMIADIEEYSNSKPAQIIEDTCLNMGKYIAPESISGILFSPPYANCFDYTEIYKLELWFGGYVNSYTDLRQLRNKSLRSHLNGLLQDKIVKTSDSLTTILDELKTKALWDKRIPQMLSLYFSDMFRVLEKCYKVLEPGGFCAIVVGNSAYSNIVVPTDLLLAEYAEMIGFKVDQIIVDRYIITSSQQYDETKGYKEFLREGIVCLQKR